MAQYARNGSAAVAVQAITIAALANTLVKSGMVLSLGSPALRRPIALAAVAVTATGAGTMLLAGALAP